MSQLDIIIPAAGLSRRMKSYGPKALISLGKETVIARQIRLLKECYPNAKVYVVAGFEFHRFPKLLPSSADIFVNNNYGTTNVANSLANALKHRRLSPSIPALIVYGDLVFDRSLIESLPLNRSSVVVSSGGGDDVGINIEKGEATHFSFGLANRWSQIVLLAPPERERFVRFASEPQAARQFTHEILNRVVDDGGTIKVAHRMSSKLIEIDNSKDIEDAIKFTEKK